MPVQFDQWSTTRPLIAGYPQWVKDPDRTRIAAYQTFEMVYWNVPEIFKLIQRGSDAKPIYIPTARQIVETLHRYLAPRISFIPDPEVGTEAEQQAAAIVMRSLARRERLYSTFSMNKRFGIIRGDWMFHILADPEREEGSRISIEAIDPASYFPIFSEEDPSVIIGVHLVEQVKDSRGEDSIYRMTYRKETERGGPSPIIVSESIFEVDAWGGPEMEEKLVESVREEERLPDPISQIPVYHIRNFDEPGADFGSSELRGMERIIAAINQSISDEELDLVMNGLGVYVTDAGSPVDEETGEPRPWNLGPAKVVEVPANKNFTRVDATKTLGPYQEHLAYLHRQLDLSASSPAIAKGQVDVEVAESGIALALQLAPIISRAEEGELTITDVSTNMLFDLKMFLEAYENVSIGDAVWVPAYGDKIPVNRRQRFDELVSLFSGGLTSASWTRSELAKIGYVFPDDTTMMTQILEEKEAIGQMEADVTGARIDRELEDDDGGE
jgi:hypothetical protein